jgi:hypothetical protein
MVRFHRSILPVIAVVGATMKDEKGKREGQAGKFAKNSRQDRLKLALRENLKRRKSQARGRSDVIAGPSDDVDVPLHDDSAEKPNK